MKTYLLYALISAFIVSGVGTFMLVSQMGPTITLENDTKHIVQLKINGDKYPVEILSGHKLPLAAYGIRSISAKFKSHWLPIDRILDLKSVLANTKMQNALVKLIPGRFAGVKTGKVIYSPLVTHKTTQRSGK